jgi:hypothetical protein
MNPQFQGPQHDKRRYVKLTANGASVVCEPFEVADMMDGDSECTVSDVWMSPAEYDALPEFMGF